jgi:hypothetical protein
VISFPLDAITLVPLYKHMASKIVTEAAIGTYAMGNYYVELIYPGKMRCYAIRAYLFFVLGTWFSNLRDSSAG